jgi:hypothetical protein
MGITAHSTNIMSNLLIDYKPKEVFELGAQYLYDTKENCLGAVNNKPVYGKEWFVSRGINHTSIDLNNEADICADIIDNDHTKKYDWVTDFGTVEHTTDAFKAFSNIHDWTKVGGLMIHVNPEVGSWPLHGYWWFTEEFYSVLADICGYKLIHVERAAAMGNTKDGWDVYGVLEKVKGSKFSISRDDFCKYLKGR